LKFIVLKNISKGDLQMFVLPMVDPELETLIPPLLNDEFEQLYCERSQISASINVKHAFNLAWQKFDAVRSIEEKQARTRVRPRANAHKRRIPQNI